MGTLNLQGGSNTISSSNGVGGSLLTFAGLTRGLNTGTVDFVAPSGSSPIGSVSATGQPINQIVFATDGDGHGDDQQRRGHDGLGRGDQRRLGLHHAADGHVLGRRR